MIEYAKDKYIDPALITSAEIEKCRTLIKDSETIHTGKFEEREVNHRFHPHTTLVIETPFWKGQKAHKKQILEYAQELKKRRKGYFQNSCHDGAYKKRFEIVRYFSNNTWSKRATEVMLAVKYCYRHEITEETEEQYGIGYRVVFKLMIEKSKLEWDKYDQKYNDVIRDETIRSDIFNTREEAKELCEKIANWKFSIRENGKHNEV